MQYEQQSVIFVSLSVNLNNFRTLYYNPFRLITNNYLAWILQKQNRNDKTSTKTGSSSPQFIIEYILIESNSLWTHFIEWKRPI